MVRKRKEKALESVIIENSPTELSLARLFKEAIKEKVRAKKRPYTPL